MIIDCVELYHFLFRSLSVFPSLWPCNHLTVISRCNFLILACAQAKKPKTVQNCIFLAASFTIGGFFAFDNFQIFRRRYKFRNFLQRQSFAGDEQSHRQMYYFAPQFTSFFYWSELLFLQFSTT